MKKLPPASCYALGKPLWTSEGWNLGKVNDWEGAINLGATINFVSATQNASTDESSPRQTNLVSTDKSYC